MENKRMTFTFGRYSLIVTIIAMTVYIFLNVFLICLCCLSNEYREIATLVLIVFGICTVMLFIVSGTVFWQWVVIDENKIAAKNIFGIIREVSWNDLKEVQEVASSFHSGHPVAKKFLFI